MFPTPSVLLQIWICTAPVLATLLLAPMLVCAQPGVWLPAPVAAIVRAATPAQIAQFRSSQPSASQALRRKASPIAKSGSVAFVQALPNLVPFLAVTFCQSAPRAP